MPIAVMEILLPPGLLLIAAAYAYILGRSPSQDPKLKLLEAVLRRSAPEPPVPVRHRRAA